MRSIANPALHLFGPVFHKITAHPPKRPAPALPPRIRGQVWPVVATLPSRQRAPGNHIWRDGLYWPGWGKRELEALSSHVPWQCHIMGTSTRVARALTELTQAGVTPSQRRGPPTSQDLWLNALQED